MYMYRFLKVIASLSSLWGVLNVYNSSWARCCFQGVCCGCVEHWVLWSCVSSLYGLILMFSRLAFGKLMFVYCTNAVSLFRDTKVVLIADGLSSRTGFWSTSGRMRSSMVSTCPRKSWPTWTKKRLNSMALSLQSTVLATRISAPRSNIATATVANPSRWSFLFRTELLISTHWHHHGNLLSYSQDVSERFLRSLLGVPPAQRGLAKVLWLSVFCLCFFGFTRRKTLLVTCGPQLCTLFA